MQRSLTQIREEQIIVGMTRRKDGRVLKRTAELREQGRRRRGRPKLKWENCKRRTTGRRRQSKTEEGGKDYQMRR